MTVWAMAFAIAGNELCDPQPASPEGPESDSTDYVMVPWDVVEKWITRARSNARKVPRDMQVSWLKNRAEADIRIWIDEYRLKTSMSLGKVIKATYLQTANAWYYDEKDVEPQRGRTRRRSPSEDTRGRDRQATGAGTRGRGNNSGGNRASDGRKETADMMRNGDRICREWNRGGCTDREADCPKRYKHCCSVVTKQNGRVCGMNNHRACDHKRQPPPVRPKGQKKGGQGQTRR